MLNSLNSCMNYAKFNFLCMKLSRLSCHGSKTLDIQRILLSQCSKNLNLQFFLMKESLNQKLFCEKKIYKILSK